ncbi:MAG TPA: secretin N-terminal domain-containing protein [Thermoanaerobaculia bacterium]|nr:secretin N-terminal domain-containing protein [Thermoanaerobaculia bacterium]
MRQVTVRLPILVLLLLVPITACTSHLASRQAEIAAQRGDWDEAVLQYMKAVEQSPESLAYKGSLMRARIKASQAHFEKAQEFEKAGVVERALVEYQQAVQLDPTNQYALARLEQAREAYAAQRNNREAQTIDQMKKRTSGTRPQPPVLNPRSNQPISLEFPEPVSIFQIYKALGDAFGINVLFDPNLKDQEIAIELKEVTAQSSLETLMRAGNHFYKVIDEHTIIIAQDTPQNRRTYEDLVIQTFFLSNSEVKDMMTILRSLVDAKKIATNEQLNAIILRDTADKVKVAERIIEANDKSKAEVVIDVELLQVNSARLRDLGVALSSYQVSQQLDLGGPTGGTGGGAAPAPTAGRVRISDLEFLNQSNWFLTLPNFLYNFVKQNSDGQLLAKPQLRITEGEKATLVIGDKVPIPLTTFNTSNTVGGSIVPITSFQYQDVGIRIDLEPRVHHNQEVTLKVKVEISQINSFRGDQPIIGTRTIESVIRLQDGETNFLAGLIRTDENNSENGMPGLSEIPLLGRLFSNKRTDAQRTDVILTLTPHIIRNAEITEEDLLPIWVGTEANMTFRGGSPRVESDVDGPFETGEETPEEIQDAIRRRLQRLPRGLRPEDGGEMIEEGEGEVPEEQQPPPGVDLAPSAPPSDIFRPPTTNPLDSPPPNPPDSESDEGVEEEPPSTGINSQASAPRTLLGGSLRTERSAESAGAVVLGEGRAGKTPAPVQVWLVPRNLKVNPGERFVVKVQASADRPISHLPLALSYDPAMLAVEQVERGTFPGEAQILADASRPGEIVLGASRMGEVPGVTGQGTVARITFRAVRSGSTRIDFSRSKAMDAELRPVVPVRARSVDVSVR